MTEYRPRLKERQKEELEQFAKEDSEPTWVTMDRILEKATEWDERSSDVL